MSTTIFVNHQPGTYKAYQTVGGWSIMFLGEDGNSRPADYGKVYKHRQNAHRRVRQLNGIVTLQQAIGESEYSTARTEYNNMYTVVDGSLLDGTYTIKTGVQGMPANEHQEVSSIEAAVKVIQEKGLLDQDWEPVGEDE